MLVFLCGPPNSGKSTTALHLVQRQWADYVISPGQWLRAQSQRDNDLGRYIKTNWDNATLEPLVVEHIDTLVRQLLPKMPRIVIEGYPRTASEASLCLKWASQTEVAVVFLDVPISVIEQRSSKRQRTGDDTASALTTRYTYYAENRSTIAEVCGKLVSVVSVSETDTLEEVVERVHNIRGHVQPYMGLDEPPAVPPCALLQPATAIETAIAVGMQQRLCQMPGKRQFCGSHPVSLCRESLPRLLRYPYHVALKIDGVRFMCLVHSGRLWFVSRKLDVFKTASPDRLLEPLNGTLIDGEFATQHCYVVLDVYTTRDGVDVSHRPILERLTHAAQLCRMFRLSEPVRFVTQEYVDRSQIALLLQRAPYSPFRIDGVILQPAKLPARTGIDYNLFKWKSAVNNTVDLLYGADHQFYCRANDTIVPVGAVHPNYGQVSWIKEGQVVECSVLPGPLWVPRSVRYDKLFPNLSWVVDAVVASVQDNITEQELIEYCEKPSVPRDAVPSPPRVKRT